MNDRAGLTGRSAKPNLVVLGTGGTIAGAGAGSANTSAYRPAVVAVDDILAAIPEIRDLANVTGEQIFQIDSADFTNGHLLALARRVSQLLKSNDVDGIVITHGTDTMEETSYFLNLTVKSAKPVVMLGAMRPGTAMSADGPLNLYNAVAVAAGKGAAGMGTLVVMNDEIHTARDVTKTHSLKVETFRSPYGPLGYVVESTPLFYRAPIRPHTLHTEFDIDEIETLPEVGIVYAHGGMGRAPYDALAAAGAKAIVHAGFGNGSVPDYLEAALRELRAKGVFLVRASRAGNGAVVRNGSAADDENDWVVVDDQNPQKARILMALALTQTAGTKELQEIFRRY